MISKNSGISVFSRKVAAALLIAILPGANFAGYAGEMTGELKSVPGPTVVESAPATGLFSFDVQERLRVEVRNNNFDFNDAVNGRGDDTWLLQRFRLGVAFKPFAGLKIYVQGQDSREIDANRPKIPGAFGAEGDDAFDLRQAYFQVGPKELNLTVGRQMLSFSDERLVGAFDWNNIGRTFDAVKVHYEQPKISVDAFASTVVQVYRDSFNQSDLFNSTETHRAQVFSGIYLSTSALEFQKTDFYVYSLNQENALPTTPAITSPAPFAGFADHRTDFFTFGTRIQGDPKKLGGFEYEGEFALQRGHVRGLDLTAFAAHAGVGYNFAGIPWKPRLWAEYNFASGDDDATDGDLQTFQNLFPTNHKFYGYMDLFSWQNIHNPELSIRVSPCEKVTLQLDGHAFWLASNEDSWYRANGVTTVRPLNAAARSASNYVGSEIDFTVTYKPLKQLGLQAGYSHFFAGDYVSDTGPQDDADFGYVMATLNF